MSQHWGEIQEEPQQARAPSIEEEDILKAMSKFCLAEFQTEFDNDFCVSEQVR